MGHDSFIHEMTRSYVIWQIGKVFETVAAGSLTVLTVYGGVPYDQQGNGLRAGNFFPGILFLEGPATYGYRYLDRKF